MSWNFSKAEFRYLIGYVPAGAGLGSALIMICMSVSCLISSMFLETLTGIARVTRSSFKMDHTKKNTVMSQWLDRNSTGHH